MIAPYLTEKQRLARFPIGKRSGWLWAVLLGGVIYWAANPVVAQTVGYQRLMQERLPANWYLTRLDNDLRVLVIEDNRVPLVTVQLGLRGGRITQSGPLAGVPELIPHLLLPAAGQLPGNVSAEGFVALHGLTPYAHTGAEHISLGIQAPKHKLPEAVALLRGAVLAPQLDTLKLVQLKIAIAKRLNAEYVSVGGFFQDQLLNAMWGSEVGRKLPNAPFVDVRSATLSDIQAYMAKYFLPNYSFIVVTGDVQHDECFALLDSALGQWPAPPFIEPDNVFFPALSRDTALVMLHDRVNIPYLSLAWQLPDVLSSPRTYAMARLIQTVMQMRNGPFVQGLVTPGEVADVQTAYQPSQYTSSLIINTTPYRDRLLSAASRLWQLVDSLQRPGFLTKQHLEIAERLLRLEYEEHQQTARQQASFVGQMWATTGLANLPEYLKQIREITVDDVREYCRINICNVPVAQAFLIDYSLYEDNFIARFVTRLHRVDTTSRPIAPELSAADREAQRIRQMMILSPEVDTTRYYLQDTASRDTAQQSPTAQPDSNAVASADSLPAPTLPPSQSTVFVPQPEYAPLFAPEADSAVADTSAQVSSVSRPDSLSGDSAEGVNGPPPVSAVPDSAAYAPVDTLPLPVPPPDVTEALMRRPFVAETLTADSMPAPTPQPVANLAPASATIATLDTAWIRVFLVYFGTNTADVDTAFHAKLRTIAAFLEQNPEWSILCEGHSDSPGPADFNLRLSEERAHTVKRFLVNNFNLSPLQVQIKAFGETRPLFPETPVEVRAKNRRVGFQLLPPNASSLP